MSYIKITLDNLQTETNINTEENKWEIFVPIEPDNSHNGMIVNFLQSILPNIKNKHYIDEIKENLEFFSQKEPPIDEIDYHGYYITVEYVPSTRLTIL